MTINIEKIRDANIKSNLTESKRLAIIYKPKWFFIGDAFCVLDYLCIMRQFFSKAIIDFCCGEEGCALLQNNPYIDNIYNRDWKELDLKEYDIVLISMDDESEFLNFICDSFKDHYNTLNVFSISEYTLGSYQKVLIFDAFNKNKKFNEFLEVEIGDNLKHSPHEIYISDDEIEWAKNWHNSHGIDKNENIIILLDSTTRKCKLLDTLVYIDFVTKIAELRNIKILIFDEKKFGKKLFYENMVSEKVFKKLVFAEGTSLRESISLLSDKRLKIIFGPCTGLLHCASGVYSIFLKKKLIEKRDIPIMIAYSGKIINGEVIAFHEYKWWDNTLVDCLKIVSTGNAGKKIKRISEEDKDFDLFVKDLLYCSDYTSDDLINYIKTEYKDKLLQFDMI